MLPLAVQAAMAAIEKICPEARNLLIIPENHAQHVLPGQRGSADAHLQHGGAERAHRLDQPEVKKPTIDLPTASRLTWAVVRNKRRFWG